MSCLMNKGLSLWLMGILSMASDLKSVTVLKFSLYRIKIYVHVWYVDIKFLTRILILILYMQYCKNTQWKCLLVVVIIPYNIHSDIKYFALLYSRHWDPVCLCLLGGGWEGEVIRLGFLWRSVRVPKNGSP